MNIAFPLKKILQRSFIITSRPRVQLHRSLGNLNHPRLHFISTTSARMADNAGSGGGGGGGENKLFKDEPTGEMVSKK